MEGLLPVLTFENGDSFRELTSIIGANVIGHSEDQIHRNISPFQMCLVQDKIFLCVFGQTSIPLCAITGKVNKHIAQKHKDGWKCAKALLAHTTIQNENHTPECQYLVTAEQVEEYLGINIEKKEDLRSWLQPDDVSLHEMLEYVIRNINDNDNYDERDDYPEQRMPKPKKRELDQEWKDKLGEPVKYVKPLENTCKACEDNVGTIAFIPCGHVYYCDACFEKAMTDTQLKKVCPLCSGSFDNIQRIIV